ncbi:uncharacterized protein B0I36DRAFT_317314 [Microdochium trichocladiopsis]|uniref:Dpy-30 motif-domain-containing protein n=1 Tax=Microdochium trichocladiopsis TaxID=1682393 RepID=A0A9P9BQJ9_9PEZI|nr:uncharacterized protein B0I36DRAFT_317314 [Microdochium trichocladiopsis]KAH7034963.1 hypothetical protein B0I36DRAFT_317314 [Microdochium trichocladiopsis]
MKSAFGFTNQYTHPPGAGLRANPSIFFYSTQLPKTTTAPLRQLVLATQIHTKNISPHQTQPATMADDKTQTPVPPPALPTFTASPAPAPVGLVSSTAAVDSNNDDAQTAREQSTNPPDVKEEADVDMADVSTAPTHQQQQPLITTEKSPAPSAPAAAATSAPCTSTPLRQANGVDGGGGGTSSRAASQHPESGAGGSSSSSHQMPSTPAVHGAPVRQYLNQNVTGVLLEGMKQIARDQPQDPLRVLGEYLLKASREREKMVSAA